MSLKGKTIFITGATRGIGEAIALRCAKEGANMVITGKTKDPHPKLPGTIMSVAKAVEAAGGKALPIQLDVRDDQAIAQAVEKTIETFGQLDILVNNASAISLTPTLETPMKRFDLMFAVNVRATFACSQACIPHLAQAKNPHILNLAPPLNMKAKWFKDHVAYTMSKYGMSMCTLGMAEELKAKKIAVNSLWPKTSIATAAIAVHFPKEVMQASRSPEIMADAAYEILLSDSELNTGNFFIDEDFLRQQGVTDFAKYALNDSDKLIQDLFLD
ncbi:MAG: NAD(P)-dependent oxidoreductase [Pseudomonadota bacterium]